MPIYKEIHTQGASKDVVEFPEIVSTQEATYIGNIANILAVNISAIAGYSEIPSDVPVFPIYFREGGEVINRTACLKLEVGYLDGVGELAEQEVQVNITSPVAAEIVSAVNSTNTMIAGLSFSAKVVAGRLSIMLVDTNSPRIATHLGVKDSSHLSKTSLTDVRNALRLFNYYLPDRRSISKVGDIKPPPARAGGLFTVPGSACVSRQEDRTSSSLNRSSIILSHAIDNLQSSAYTEEAFDIKVGISLSPLADLFYTNSSVSPECQVLYGQGKVVIAVRGFTLHSYIQGGYPNWQITDQNGEPTLRLHSNSADANSSTKYNQPSLGTPIQPSDWYLIDEVGMSVADFLSFDSTNTDLVKINELVETGSTNFTRVDSITYEFDSVPPFREPNTLVSTTDTDGNLVFFTIREWLGNDRAIVGDLSNSAFESYVIGQSVGSFSKLPPTGSLSIYRSAILNKGQWAFSIYDGYLNTDLLDTKQLNLNVPAFAHNLLIEEAQVGTLTKQELHNYLVKLSSDQSFELGTDPNITLKSISNYPLGKSLGDLGSMPEANPIEVFDTQGTKLSILENSVVDAPKSKLSSKSNVHISVIQGHAITENPVSDATGVQDPTFDLAQGLVNGDLPDAEALRQLTYLKRFVSGALGEVTAFTERDILQSNDLFNSDLVGRMAYLPAIGNITLDTFLSKGLMLFSKVDKMPRDRSARITNTLYLISLDDEVGGTSINKIPSAITVVSESDSDSSPALDVFGFFDPDATEHTTISASSLKKSLSGCFISYNNLQTRFNLSLLSGSIYSSLTAKNICRKIYAPAYPATDNNPFFVADVAIEIYMKSGNPVPPLRISSQDLIYKSGEEDNVYINSTYLFRAHDNIAGNDVQIGLSRLDAYLVEYISNETSVGFKAPSGIKSTQIHANSLQVEAKNATESAIFRVMPNTTGLGEDSANSIQTYKSVVDRQGVSVSSTESLTSYADIGSYSKTTGVTKEDGGRSFDSQLVNKEGVQHTVRHFTADDTRNEAMIRAEENYGESIVKSVETGSTGSKAVRLSASQDGSRINIHGEDAHLTMGGNINETEIRKDYTANRDTGAIYSANTTLTSDQRLDRLIREGAGDAKYGTGLFARMIEEIDKLKEFEHRANGIISMLNSKTLYMNSAIQSLLKCVEELRYIVDAYESNGQTVHHNEPIFALFKYTDQEGDPAYIAPPINEYQRSNRTVRTGYLFHNLNNSGASSAGPQSDFRDRGLAGVTIQDLIQATDCINANILRLIPAGSSSEFDFDEQIAGLGVAGTATNLNSDAPGLPATPNLVSNLGTVPYGSYRPVYESGVRDINQPDLGNNAPSYAWRVKTLVPFTERSGASLEVNSTYAYARPTCLPVSEAPGGVNMADRYTAFKIRDPDDLYASGEDIGFKIAWGGDSSASPRYSTTHDNPTGPDYLDPPRTLTLAGTGSEVTTSAFFSMYFNDSSSRRVFLPSGPLTDDGYNRAFIVRGDALVVFTWWVAVGVPYAEGVPVRLGRMYRDQSSFSNIANLTNDYSDSDDFIVVKSNDDSDRCHILRTPCRVAKEVIGQMNSYVPFSTDLVFREGSLITDGMHVSSSVNNYSHNDIINIAGTQYQVVRNS